VRVGAGVVATYWLSVCARSWHLILYVVLSFRCRVLLRRIFRRWCEAVAMCKHEKQQAHRRQQIWRKVQGWMDDDL